MVTTDVLLVFITSGIMVRTRFSIIYSVPFIIDWLAIGKSVLEGALRFLKACQHPFNVHSIRAELDAADFSHDPVEDTTLCPFIAALFWGCIASPVKCSHPSIILNETRAPSTDGRFGRMYGPLSLSYTLSLLDNNDGISVFDITNLSDPRYCFVSINGLEAAADDSLCRIFW